MNLLTADLGNSRCKLRIWELAQDRAPKRVAGIDLDSATALGERAEAWLGETPRVDGAALCSVAAPEIERALSRVLAQAVSSRSGPGFDPALDPGLAIACREPAKVGLDRLFAARAALERCAGSAIVLDAGTALTVDAVRADGTFLGGAIAPGPDLLAGALARGTARLPRVEPRPGARALGRDTREALEAGIVVGFRGAARELVERLAEESSLPDAPLVVTGGARGFLLDPSTFGSRRIVEDADLVHHGLRIAYEASRSASSGTPSAAPKRT